MSPKIFRSILNLMKIPIAATEIRSSISTSLRLWSPVLMMMIALEIVAQSWLHEATAPCGRSPQGFTSSEPPASVGLSPGAIS